MTRDVTRVEIDVDGDRFEGFYAVESGMLTVWHPCLGSRSTQFSGPLARYEVDALMAEIIRIGGQRQKRSIGLCA